MFMTAHDSQELKLVLMQCLEYKYEIVFRRSKNFCTDMIIFFIFKARLPRSYISHLVRKPTICICENKEADQLRVNSEADQRLCFRYTDSTISPLLKSKISNF